MLLPSPAMRMRASLSGTRLMQTIDFKVPCARFRCERDDRNAVRPGSTLEFFRDLLVDLKLLDPLVDLELLDLFGRQRVEPVGDQVDELVGHLSLATDAGVITVPGHLLVAQLDQPRR